MRFLAPVFCLLLATSSAGFSASVATDTARTTAAGHAFIQPSDWSLTRKASAIYLTSPEAGSYVALIDVAQAANADAAVAAAWLADDGKNAPKLEQQGERPIRNGWDQIVSYRYALAADAKRSVFAQALRQGKSWTVVIADLSDAVVSKRESQLELIFGRLWPKGYVAESFAGKKAHKLDARRIALLTQFIADAQPKFGVPGVAIGVIQDGKVVFAGGFGVREVGKPAKVDANTLFMIASDTKALTTLMLAKQVDAGKYAWNTPVTKLLPSFRVGDAQTTARVQMRHMVCACTGMPRQDMETIFEGHSGTPKSVLAALATMQPTSQFGELYQYSNAMAAAAGYVGAHVQYPRLEYGAGYDLAMQKLVFDPLGMASTTFDFARATRGNYAVPHGETIDGKTAAVDLHFHRYGVPSRPDGGAWSNVNDMLRYLQMELSLGLLPNGKRYIGAAALLERRVQQVATGSGTGYGMGLKLDQSWGTLLIHHGGSDAGYRADKLWLPEHQVGAVILSNADSGTLLRYPFRRRLVELLFDGKPEAAQNIAAQAQRVQAERGQAAVGLSAPADPLVAGKLANRYHSTELGDIDVRHQQGAIWFDFGGWQSEMASRSNSDGSVTFVSISPGLQGYEFALSAAADRGLLKLNDGQRDYTFSEAK